MLVIPSLLGLLTTPAQAGEVVWLDAAPSPADVALVAAQAGDDDGRWLTADAFRAAAWDVGPDDRAAWQTLSNALQEVRAFETRLDGELLIMRELQRPLQAITVVPDEDARDQLYAALAYQGFAVDRFFADALATEARAADFRTALPSGVAPSPWVDAIALDPERKPTPYEIAEAPQRVRFNEVRDRVLAELLPGLLVVEGGLPEGSTLVVDGRETPLDATGQTRLMAGRHLAHVARDGHFLARFDVRIDAGGETVVRMPLADAGFERWVSDVRAGNAQFVPAGLEPSLEALGDDVHIAWTDDKGRLQVVRVDGTALTPVKVEAARVVSSGGDTDRDVEIQVGVGVGGGWFSSGDFYLQDPANVPRTVAAVNSGTVQLAVDVGAEIGLFRVSAIADTAATLGANHVAFYGDDGRTRIRPDVSLGVGVRWVQATAGYLFPHHPTVGGRVTIPVYEGLEVLGYGRVGLPVTLARADGTEWTGAPVYQAWLGVGYRFGFGVGR